jgi:hypothetical protein
MGWDGMGWDGDGRRCDAMRCDGMGGNTATERVFENGALKTVTPASAAALRSTCVEQPRVTGTVCYEYGADGSRFKLRS